MTHNEEAFEEWLAHGVLNGWISYPACATHDGIPSTDAETEAWEEGWDPCEHVLRLWPREYRSTAKANVAMDVSGQSPN